MKYCDLNFWHLGMKSVTNLHCSPNTFILNVRAPCKKLINLYFLKDSGNGSIIKRDYCKILYSPIFLLCLCATLRLRLFYVSELISRFLHFITAWLCWYSSNALMRTLSHSIAKILFSKKCNLCQTSEVRLLSKFGL